MVTKAPSLKRQIVGGVGWVTVARLGKQGLQIIFNLILARLLSPVEFGLIGMVSVFFNFAALFTELGFAEALVQRKSIEERHLSSVFWLNLGLSALLLLIFILAAPLIAQFYGEEALQPITIIISFNFLISAFNDVQMALLMRSLAFRRLVLINLVSVILAGIVAILMAANGFGVWSLVAQILVLTATEVLITWLTTHWKPRLLLDRSALRELMGFSLNLVGSQVFAFWIRNLDNLLIGRFVSAGALGLYRQSYAIFLLPTSQVTQTLSTVMFPVLSRIQDDKPLIKIIILRAHRIIALVTMPMAAGLFVVADSFVMTLLGKEWIEMVPILRVLCLVAFKQPLGATTGWIYKAVGRTDVQLKWTVIDGFFAFAGFFLGIRWGVMGVATAYAIRSYVFWYPSISVPGQLIGLKFSEYFRNISGIIAISLLMGIGVYAIGLLLPEGWLFLARLAIQVSVGAVIYVVLITVFRVAAYQDLVTTIREGLKRES